VNRKFKIALIGNPNSGKTSLFNGLTGLRQKIGNFPGITVDKKTGYFNLAPDHEVELLDLPGTYSIYPKSKDEEIVTEVLLDKQNENHPDGVIVVTDASTLKRNLLLCSQIIDLNLPTVIALTMTDIVEKEQLGFDLKRLEEQLGVPVVQLNARKNVGLDQLKATLLKTMKHPLKPFLQDEFYAQPVIDMVKNKFGCDTNYSAFYLLMSGQMQSKLDEGQRNEIQQIIREYNIVKGAWLSRETVERYKIINTIYKSVTGQKKEALFKITEKLDKILIHRIWGYLILAAVLFTVFQAIFLLADYPMQWVEKGISLLSEALLHNLPTGWATNLLVDGVIAGIGGVVVFIPQIAILFGFLTIMEDTGYMARVSFLTDRLMRTVGLNGKSVVPLMSGMACAIPAIMSARNIDNRKERLITILVTPFMSCSARLPVYTLIISLTIPNENLYGFINLQGATLFSLYILGIATAMLVAFILNRFIHSEFKSFFIMELPMYRPPRWKNVFITMFEKGKVFTLQAGKIILIISIFLWFLASYGPEDLGWKVNKQVLSEQVQKADNTPEMNERALQLRNSFAGHLGKFIEPVIQPLGFDWKMGIALITSFAAREVFVGTMATIYSVEADKDNFDNVRQRMANDIDPKTGKPVYTIATAISLLIFFALAMQCMSTLAVVKRETKSWKWPLVQVTYMSILAYSASWAVYQLIA
jgi:ferrous iron transport protein B